MSIRQHQTRLACLTIGLLALFGRDSAAQQRPNCSRPSTTSASTDTTSAPARQPGGVPFTGAAARPAAPVMFAAPTPTGEIAGARNSIALPSLRVSLPKISLETPELRLSGFTRFRREPEMILDGAAAARSHVNPLLMGQLAGAGLQQQQPRPDTTSASAEPDEDTTPAGTNVPEGCDGCVSSEQQKIYQLSQQIHQLQTLVAHLNQANSRGAEGAYCEHNRESTFSADEPMIGEFIPVNSRRHETERHAHESVGSSGMQGQMARLTQQYQQVSAIQSSAPQNVSVQPAGFHPGAAGGQSQMTTQNDGARPNSNHVSEGEPKKKSRRGWRRFIPWSRK